MSKPTPGPWDTDDMHKSDDYRYVIAEEHVVCRVMLRGIMGNKFEHAEANARLIAAAPDLLAICEELAESADYWSEYDVPIGIVQRLKNAIAKATGEAK